MKNLGKVILTVIITLMISVGHLFGQGSTQLSLDTTDWEVNVDTPNHTVNLMNESSDMKIHSFNTTFTTDNPNYHIKYIDDISEGQSINKIIVKVKKVNGGDADATLSLTLNNTITTSEVYINDTAHADSNLSVNYTFYFENNQSVESFILNFIHNREEGSTDYIIIEGITLFYEHTASINEKNILESNINIKTFNNQLHIQSKESMNNVHMNMYSMNGQEVLNERFDIYNRKSFDTSHLNEGVYIVNFRNDNNTVQKKVMIRK